MMTSKFFGGVRGFAIAGNSMRTRIFLFLFFASTSGLWAQQARQVREVREERGEEARVQETNPAQGDIDRGAGTPAATDNNGRIINRRIRVGEKKDNDQPSKHRIRGPEGIGPADEGWKGDVEAVRDPNFVNILAPPAPAKVFVRGDVNGDGQIWIDDAMALGSFLGGPSANPSSAGGQAWLSGFDCLDAADADDDGRLSHLDAMKIYLYVFASWQPLPAPSASSYNYIASDCGEDLTGDSLGCDIESAVCQGMDEEEEEEE